MDLVSSLFIMAYRSSSVVVEMSYCACRRCFFGAARQALKRASATRTAASISVVTTVHRSFNNAVQSSVGPNAILLITFFPRMALGLLGRPQVLRQGSWTNTITDYILRQLRFAVRWHSRPIARPTRWPNRSIYARGVPEAKVVRCGEAERNEGGASGRTHWRVLRFS